MFAAQLIHVFDAFFVQAYFAAELEEKIKGLRDRIAELQNMAKWQSEAFGDYALSITSLGQAHHDAVGKALATGSIASYAKLSSQQLLKLGAGFDSDADEMVLLLTAVRSAVKAREDARLQLQSGRDRLNQLRVRQSKGEILEPEIGRAQTSVETEEAGFAKVQARCLRDVKHFEDQYQRRLREMFVRHLEMEVESTAARAKAAAEALAAVKASTDVADLTPAPVVRRPSGAGAGGAGGAAGAAGGSQVPGAQNPFSAPSGLSSGSGVENPFTSGGERALPAAVPPVAAAAAPVVEPTPAPEPAAAPAAVEQPAAEVVEATTESAEPPAAPGADGEPAAAEIEDAGIDDTGEGFAELAL
jgi:hypothetical protein